MHHLIWVWGWIADDEVKSRRFPLWMTQLIDMGAELQFNHPNDDLYFPYLGGITTRISDFAEGNS